MKKLRFYLNKKLDKQMAEEFLNVSGGGIDFGAGIMRTHPQLSSLKSMDNTAQRDKILHAYFNNYYRVHRNAILRKIKNVRDAWYKQEQKYITTTENYFSDFKFPKGKYIAYASIIDCNPRFLDSKTFQFFYKKNVVDAIYVITHELLHFIFFDFVKQKLEKETKCLSEDELWDLSEIFNVVVLKSSRYRHIIRNQNSIHTYPDHQHYIPRFEKAYKKSNNAEEFIKHGVAIISTKKL